MIHLQNIYKTFDVKGSPLTVLNDVSLDIKKGEIFGVIGASGAGKSTLIRCVNLLERPISGQVLVDGVDLMQLNEADLIQARRQIGMIFQHFNLLHSRTAFENIALALELSKTPKAQIHNKVNELLQLVGLADKANSYPANLSGGQKQRVAIARALACDPKVLLCDEATSALDPATTQAILTLLQEINQRLGITILLITHEMDVVKRICHRVAVMDKGKMVEQDSVSRLFSEPKTALAQAFIRSTFHIDLPADYRQKLMAEPAEGRSPILRLEFTGQSVDAPILSQMTKLYGTDFSILTSQIDYVDGVKFGILIVELLAEQTMLQQSIAYLTEQHVKVEVLGYVA